MPQLHIIAVGRLREKHWKEAAEAYATRIRRRYDLRETIIKDGDASLAMKDRVALEGDRILHVLGGNLYPVCLDERGETMTSVAFARFIQTTIERAHTPCFILGGAYGLADVLREKAAKLLSFGPMTLPHELARVVLYEQLYRADSIIAGRPYHHA